LTESGPDAATRWREQLAAWALPERILVAVPDSPWTIPKDVFARRADDSVAAPAGPSYERAAEALRPSGTVLDVGAGAGAASLPLTPWATRLTAVDSSEEMLAAYAERAAALGVAHDVILGRWPEAAAQVAPADVVVCHHVFYNVPDLPAFVRALTDRARRRVVVELTQGHPVRVLNPLWKQLHDLDRPDGPTAADAVAVLREAGIFPHRDQRLRPTRPEYASFDALVAVTRRRLCLTPERDPELADALVRLGVDPEHPRDLTPGDEALVTLWWDVDYRA
jgi:SAM-dependent methyltransferase